MNSNLDKNLAPSPPFNALREEPTPRMTVIVPKYSPLLYSLLFLLLVDFLINSFSELIMSVSIAMLVIYIVQDICILFTALVLLLMLINTYMFQAGLIGYMIGKFKMVWVLTVIYWALTIALQIWLLVIRWDKPTSFVWQSGQLALYVIQRSTAVLFYYIYKRASYRLSDPRFYEDSEWLRKEFEKRH